VVLFVFVMIYDAFKIGIMRMHELVYSMSLSLALLIALCISSCAWLRVGWLILCICSC
jgi:hypothetical protein